MRAFRESLFDLGLLAFPSSFRRVYGPEMREVARERFAELGWYAALSEALDAGIAGTRMRFEQINAAMRRYLDLSKMTIIKAGDFAKAAAVPGK